MLLCRVPFCLICVWQTFQLKDSQIPEDHVRMWWDVHYAQETALHIAKAGIITAEVDSAARKALNERGLGSYFTHRLGHGDRNINVMPD